MAINQRVVNVLYNDIYILLHHKMNSVFTIKTVWMLFTYL